jgi:hypothetical protein
MAVVASAVSNTSGAVNVAGMKNLLWDTPEMQQGEKKTHHRGTENAE